MTVKHPATFSDAAIDAIHEAIKRHARRGKLRILDPFAGVGTIHKLSLKDSQRYSTVGIELEKEWAEQHSDTIVGDALAVPLPLGLFEVVATSVCYANRMADHHEAKDGSTRHTYRHYLGRMPSDGSAAVQQWGQEYRDFHVRWLRHMHDRMTLRGLLVVDIKDHVRAGRWQGVVEWWAGAAVLNGFDFVEDVTYAVPSQRHGANGDARADVAHLLVFSLRVDGDLVEPEVEEVPELVDPDPDPVVSWPWGIYTPS